MNSEIEQEMDKMTEITKNIAAAMAKIGQEKLEAAGGLAGLQQLLAEQGLQVSTEEIKAALEAVAGASAKAELSEESLEDVAGGVGPAAIVPFIPTIIDVTKKLINGGDKDKKDGTPAPAAPAAPGNTQENKNSHSAQQATQTGNNINEQGMNVS